MAWARQKSSPLGKRGSTIGKLNPEGKAERIVQARAESKHGKIKLRTLGNTLCMQTGLTILGSVCVKVQG